MTRVRLVQLKMSTVFSGAYALVLAGGFWYVATQAGAGQLTLGDLALYLGAVTQAQSVATRMSVWFGMFYGVLPRLRALFDFLDQARPAIELPRTRSKAVQAPAPLEQGLELRQIGFRYPESTQAVLADVSAVLPAGQRDGAGRGQRRRQEHARQAAHPHVRPGYGQHPPRWHAPPRLRPGLLAASDCRRLSRLCPVCPDLTREHRGRCLRGR